MTVAQMLLKVVPGIVAATKAAVAATNGFVLWFTPRKASFVAVLSALTAWQTGTLTGPQALAAVIPALAAILGFVQPKPTAAK